jgi:hypothetical protein
MKLSFDEKLQHFEGSVRHDVLDAGVSSGITTTGAAGNPPPTAPFLLHHRRSPSPDGRGG